MRTFPPCFGEQSLLVSFISIVFINNILSFIAKHDLITPTEYGMVF